MTHSTHLWWMTAFAAAGVVLWVTGAVGAGALVVLWPVACLAMMAVMMWAMRTGGDRSR